MKNIKYLLILPIMLLALSSCSSDSDTLGVSDVTNYPILEVQGGDPILVHEGTAFTDPGVIATEGGVEIDYTTDASGDYRGNAFDVNKSDRYTFTYEATNSDGFSATAQRKVYVYKTGDFVNSLEGLYISTVKRNGSLMSASQGSSVNMKYVIIWKNTDGSYEVSDAVGGWYELGRNYGIAYASRGMKFTINSIASNSYTFTNPSGVGSFGGTITVQSMTATPATKTLVINTKWLAPTLYNFQITLTQVP